MSLAKTDQDQAAQGVHQNGTSRVVRLLVAEKPEVTVGGGWLVCFWPVLVWLVECCIQARKVPKEPDTLQKAQGSDPLLLVDGPDGFDRRPTN